MSEIFKSPGKGRWLSNQSNSRDYPYTPLLTNTNVDHMADGSSATYDGYTFKTDWNGSTNYMRYTRGDISSRTRTDGMHLYTWDTIGKDRDLWVQLQNNSEGPMSRNVVGYTGLWQPRDNSGHICRLDMVVFHYMDENGNRTADYKVNYNLHSYSSSSHYWEYGNTGSKDVNVDWHIAYVISPGNRSSVVNNGWLLRGMSMQIRFRTPTSGQKKVDGYYYNFAPITANPGSTNLSSISAADAKAAEGQIIYQRSNRGRKTTDSFSIAF